MSKRFFVFSAIVLFLSIAVGLMLNNSLSFRLAKWRISMNLSGFKLVSYSLEKTSFSKVEKLEALLTQTTVKIDKTTIDSHAKYIKDKKFALESLFLPTTSPYPEVITNIIECPDEFKPKVEMVNNGIVYSLLAGERFNYGICITDIVKFYSEYGIFDCKGKGIFEIRVFSADGKITKEIMKTFKC